MKKALQSISMCVCVAIILSILTPLSSAHAASNPLLAEESESFSEVYWCSDEEAFLNLFPPSNSIAAEASDPSGNYQYTITEGPDNSASIDLTIEINGQEISTSGDGIISTLNDGTKFLDGKLRGQFETSTEFYSILVAFQKILGQEDEFIGITFTTTTAENSEILFLDLGTPVLSIDLVDHARIKDSEPQHEKSTEVYSSDESPFKEFFAHGQDYLTVKGYRDHTSREGKVVAFDIYSDISRVERIDFGKGELYGTSVGEVSIALEGDPKNGHAKIDGFYKLPVNLVEEIGVGKKISFSDFASVMIDIIALRYPVASEAINIIKDTVTNAYKNLRGIHHVEIAADNSRYAYICDFNYYRPDLSTFACLDDGPLTVMYELDFLGVDETEYLYQVEVTMDYYVVYMDLDLERFYTHYVEAKPLSSELTIYPLDN